MTKNNLNISEDEVDIIDILNIFKRRRKINKYAER